MALSDRLYDRQFVPQQGSGIFQRTTPGNEGEAQGFGFDQQPMSGPTEPQPVPGYNSVAVRRNERGEDEYGVMTLTRGFTPVRGNPGTMSFKMDAAEVARMDLMEQERQVSISLPERRFAAERQDATALSAKDRPIPANQLPPDVPDHIRNSPSRKEQVGFLTEAFKAQQTLKQNRDKTEQKALSARSDKEAGQAILTGALTDLHDAHTRLQSQGAYVSPDRTWWRNSFERFSGSDIGQFIAGYAGTEAQNQRDEVEQIRPLVMAGIKKATGLTGKELDSNRELQFYLAAATDVTRSKEANMAAIQRLDRMYGGGLGIKASGAEAARLASDYKKSNSMQARVTQAGYSYEPAKYQYRIAPDGKVQRAPKAQ